MSLANLDSRGVTELKYFDFRIVTVSPGRMMPDHLVGKVYACLDERYAFGGSICHVYINADGTLTFDCHTYYDNIEGAVAAVNRWVSNGMHLPSEVGHAVLISRPPLGARQ